jgi:hypothetical protein
MEPASTPSREWVQPTWSNTCRSVQDLISKFIYSDTLKNRVSALSSNDVDESQADEAQLAESQPWDRQALLHRLKTYR